MAIQGFAVGVSTTWNYAKMSPKERSIYEQGYESGMDNAEADCHVYYDDGWDDACKAIAELEEGVDSNDE